MGTDGARVVLAGVHGYGQWHLLNLRALASRSAITLVGVCDPRPLGPHLRALAGEVPAVPELTDLLAMTVPDVTIVCTPIHTHTDLALLAARAGSHVLLEKPPAPAAAELTRLVDGVRATGRACQIGFQSLGSGAVDAVRALIAEGAVGQVHGIGAAGAAIRDTAYYARGAWAGRRRLEGQPVSDGVLTNPFAHGLAAALRIDGSQAPDDVDVADVDVELYRAHAIEADDTACVRFRTARGTVVCAAATLCAGSPEEPHLVVHGDQGRITWWYQRDEVRVEGGGAGGGGTSQHPRVDLLENLVGHVADPAVPLLVPPESTRAFMNVVEAIRLAPDPRPIAAEHQHVTSSTASAAGGTDPTAGRPVRRVVSGVDRAIERAAMELRLFSELDLPWANR